MAVVQTGDNKWAVAKYIVDPVLGLGTHTTITAAMAAAVSGDVIAVRQGTYTEDFTITPGVTLTTMGGSGNTPAVTIVGKVSMTGAGTSTIYGIRLQTNSDFAIAVTGIAASVLNVVNCFINCTNNTGISFASSSASSLIEIKDCNGNLGTTGIRIFAHSSTGTLNLGGGFSNSGASITANTCSAGVCNINAVVTNPTTFSGTASGTFERCVFDTATQNVTAFTAGGNVFQNVKWSRFSSGTASAISLSQPLMLEMCDINSSNTNTITGVGTLSYAGLTFSGSSSGINSTGQTILNTGPSGTYGSANNGGTNTLTIANTSNTASSSAINQITVGGSTAADPKTTWTVTGVTSWSMGIDNSVTSPTDDPFVISQGTELGTTNVVSVATSGEVNFPLQPAFLAYLGATVLNKSGTGTSYVLGTDALTEVFDQNSDFNINGTFTAPVTGKYHLDSGALTVGCTIASTFNYSISSSNRIYGFQNARVASAANFGIAISALCDMDLGDTASMVISVVGEAADTVDIYGQASPATFFSGFLSC